MTPGLSRPTGSAVLAAAAAAATTRTALDALRRHPPGGRQRWSRLNYRGQPVTLLAGPALTAGSALGLTVATGLPSRLRVAGLLSVAGAAGSGLYDDLAGSGRSRGLRGHLRALRAGQVTTGAVKVIGIGASGLAAGALVTDSAGEALESAACIALAANMVNLLDLRPGRALKATLACAPALLGPAGALLAVPLAGAAALLPLDLGERTMLGDAGAGVLGAQLGLAVAASAAPGTRRLVLAALLVATLASEVVSFTDVIARTPVLRAVDELGRQA